MAKEYTNAQRRRLKTILQKRRGSMADIARELQLAQSSVSLWLDGHFPSARIAEAVEKKAREILASGK